MESSMDVTNPPPGVTEMADVLPDGLIVVDQQGILAFCSSRAGRLMAVDHEAILGHRRPARSSRCTTATGGPGGTTPTRGTRCTPCTGHREKLLWTASGIELLVTARYLRKPAKGPVRRVLMSVRDASARQRAEQDHAALISTIAHELRSPLTSVKGFSATLLRGLGQVHRRAEAVHDRDDGDRRRPGVAAHHRAARRLPPRRRPPRRTPPAGRPPGHGPAPRRAAQGRRPAARPVRRRGRRRPARGVGRPRPGRTRSSRTSWRTPCGTGTAPSPSGS